MELAQETLNALFADGELERKSLNAFTAEKKAEFAEIRKMLAEAKQHLTEISNLLNHSTSIDTAILEIQSRGNKLVEEIGIELGVFKKEFDALRDSSNALSSEQSENTRESKQVVEKTNVLYEFIKGKEQEIIKLLGMAADASLGTKYNSRGEQIGKALRFWQWAVPVSVIIAVAWVLTVFTCLKTTDFGEWVNLGINLLKTSPAFILMGFIFSQYGKERNLQEEWMFKAAVAMTINTYANLLEDKDKETNLSRQQLILNALKQVHSPPQLYGDKTALFSLRAKELRTVLESLNETMQNIKPH